MRQIKYTISFLWGVVYTLCVYLFIRYNGESWVAIPVTFVILSTVAIAALAIVFLVENWQTD